MTPNTPPAPVDQVTARFIHDLLRRAAADASSVTPRSASPRAESPPPSTRRVDR